MPPRLTMPKMHSFANLLARPGQFVTLFRPVGPQKAAARGRSYAVRAGGLVSIAAAALALVVASSGAHAAGLGRLTVRSELGQPLNAEVEVPAVGRDEAPSLQVRLASQAAFKQSNLEFNPSLTQLRFEVITKDDGSYAVHITSAQAISEPYLDLLLELTWSSGRVLREYCLLYTSDAADE